MPSLKSRLAWADTARGIGIVLVVFGHAALGLMHAHLAREEGLLSSAVKYIYVFHMPLFFWLSGLFAKDKLQTEFHRYFSQVLRVIAYPYVVWASLQICVQTIFSRFTNEPASFADFLTVLTHPSRQFWFLYVLALIKCVHWLLARVFPSNAAVFAASVTLHIAFPLVFPRAWSPLLLTFLYLPLVTSATWFACHTDFLARLSRTWCWLGALACFSIIAVSRPTAPSERPFLLAQALAGAAGVVLVSVALSPAAKHDEVDPSWSRWLRVLGAASLEIYVAHTLASAGFRIVLSQMGITNVSIHLIGGTLVGILFPLALMRVAKKADFPYLFTLRKRGSRSTLAMTPGAVADDSSNRPQ